MDETHDPAELAERVARLEREVAELKIRFAPPAADAPAGTGPGQAAPPPPLPRARPVPTPIPSPQTSHSPPREEPRPAMPRPQQRQDGRGAYPEPAEPLPDLRAALRKWNLWPPEGEGNIEVQVGAWWATRIGALLAVIGVVFFGIYVAQGTAPWVRLLQLAAVALGVTAVGHWLERREGKFGAVIFGSGLALVFFTCFAAYAVPAVKIIGQPLLGVALQGAAVAAIAAASFWKNRSNLATMAILFGFVTCLFSFFEQLQDISLVAAFLLAVAAAGLWLAKGWLPPLGLSVPAGYLIYGVIVLFGWSKGGPPSFAVALAFPVAAFLLYTATDTLGLLRGRGLPVRERRLLLGASAAGAVGLGLLATSRYFGESIAGFYFLFAGLFLAGALAYYLREQEDEIAHIWFAAGMGLLALGLIEVLDARTRWMALGVQSLVVLFTARRTRLWTAEAVMGGLWIASAALFVADTASMGLFREPGGIRSLWGATATAYLALSGVLLSLQAEWFGNRSVTIGRRNQSEGEIHQGRFQLNALYAVLLGAVAAGAVLAGFSADYLPAGATGALLLLAVIGVATGHWLVFAAAVLPFLLSQASFWALPDPAPSPWTVWLNAGLVIGTAVGVAAVAHLAVRLERLSGDLGRLACGVANVVWLVAVQALLFRVASLETSLFVAALLAVALLLVAGWRRVPYLADLAPVPVALALAAGWVSHTEGLPNLPASGQWVFVWVAAIAVFAATAARDCWKWLDGLEPLLPNELVARGIGAIVATALGLYAVGSQVDYPALPAALGMGGLLVLLLGRWPGWPVAVYSAAVFVLGGHLALIVSLGLERGDELAGSLVLAATTLACAVLARNERIIMQRRDRPGMEWVMGGLTMASLFLVFVTRTGPLEPFTTVFWGLSAIALFLTGLVWRVKPLRVLGLIGLGLCLPRVFLIDIHSMFYRIAAFVVVGIVLLIVGFLYHKFRNRIAGIAPVAGEKLP